MIKKVIFDLDNTLIMWKKDYINALIDTMKCFDVKKDPAIIDDIIESLEKKYEIISKKILLNDINRICDLNLDMNFINKLFENQKKLAEIDDNLIEIIKYLSKKYELVVLSNYFKEIQIGRLKTAKIYDYFTNVYGGDDVKLKPNKESYLRAIYPNKIEECIMIGDSLKYDIEGALKIGLKAILYDYNNKLPDSEEYIKINKLEELKNIL